MLNMKFTARSGDDDEDLDSRPEHEHRVAMARVAHRYTYLQIDVVSSEVHGSANVCFLL